MSKEDLYFTLPLAILRSGGSGGSGGSAHNVLEDCVSFGIVNAGIGFRKVKSDEEVAALLEKAKETAENAKEPAEPPDDLNLRKRNRTIIPLDEAQELWESGLLGAHMLNVSGGSRVADVNTWLRHHNEGEVFFRIKSSLLWAAVHQSREERGMKVPEESPRISWREFRIYAAILSAKQNSYGFSFLGWEEIQARACGYHSKKLFNEGRKILPSHCAPLTRQMIRTTTERMEGLGFFARCRYANGARGGLMAYSVRHPNREDLPAGK